MDKTTKNKNEKTDHRTAVPAAAVESAARDESLAAYAGPAFAAPVRIRVTSYRKRAHDTDGVSVKAVLDGIVARGILGGDTAKYVRQICFESYSADEERTVIEIEEIGPAGHG